MTMQEPGPAVDRSSAPATARRSYLGLAFRRRRYLDVCVLEPMAGEHLHRPFGDQKPLVV